jgi:tetratricopeptide (TPR) repeat protein
MSVVHQDIASLEKRVGHQGSSPLFAQLASYYLEQSRALDALRLCDAGLANFPFYTTGHLIKGKTLLALKMYAEARREFEFVREFLPNNNAIRELLANVPAEEEILPAPVEEQPEPPVSSPKPTRGFEIPPVVEQPAVVTRTVGIPASAVEQPVQDFGFTQPTPVQQEQSFTPSEPVSHANPFDSFTLPPVLEAPAAAEPTPFADFSFIPPAVSPTPEPQNFAAEQLSNFDFPFSQQQETPPTSGQQEESFEKFTMRKSSELSGENTITLDDYFAVDAQASSSTPVPEKIFDNTPPKFVAPAESNKIEELADKLQRAGKITPVINFAQKETPTVSEEETPSSVGFVTPTLAEIYAKQGWYDDAIKAYKTLARNKPADRERFEQRVVELEALKQQAGPQ